MSTSLQVGACVRVAGHGLGMLELLNDDNTWSVGFEDGHECDLPAECIELALPLPGAARLVSDAAKEAKPQGWTRFVCFSDTHGLHAEIPPKHCVEADVLLHAGDFSNTGELEQVDSFAKWLKAYPASHKVVIAGNHDITFQPGYYKRAWRRYHPKAYSCQEVRRALVSSGCCTYLEDCMAEVLGYRIYGSPWQPEFCDWAFNMRRGADSRACWARIPQEVDVLITHGPPLGRGDCIMKVMQNVGCPDLLEAIKARGVPVSLAGHIHEGYGAKSDGTTLYVNASTCTSDYRPVNPPIILDLPPPAQLRGAARAAAAADLAAGAPGGAQKTACCDIV